MITLITELKPVRLRTRYTSHCAMNGTDVVRVPLSIKQCCTRMKRASKKRRPSEANHQLPWSCLR
jgi:hypothetical protein